MIKRIKHVSPRSEVRISGPPIIDGDSLSSNLLPHLTCRDFMQFCTTPGFTVMVASWSIPFSVQSHQVWRKKGVNSSRCEKGAKFCFVFCTFCFRLVIFNGCSWRRRPLAVAPARYHMWPIGTLLGSTLLQAPKSWMSAPLHLGALFSLNS